MKFTFVRLSSGHIIVVDSKDNSFLKGTKFRGRNIASPTLRTRTYLVKDVNTDTHLLHEEVKTTITGYMNKNLYIGEHLPTNSSSPATVTKALQEICAAVGASYYKCSAKHTSKESLARAHKRIKKPALTNA